MSIIDCEGENLELSCGKESRLEFLIFIVDLKECFF